MPTPARRLLLAGAPLIVAIAARIYLGRFERLFDDHTTFAGITYTDAHVTVTGMLLVAIALAAGRNRPSWSQRSSPLVSAGS